MIVELFQGTAPAFAFCAFLFILMSAVTFNLAEGFATATGGYVFFFSTLVVIVGLCTKAFIGQAADTNLAAPKLDMIVYLVSMCGMYGAVFLSRKLVPKKGILEDVVADRVMLDSAFGCLITGVTIYLVGYLMPRSEGSVMSAVGQLNRFLPMSIILGTIYQIRRSGGSSSFNTVVLLGISINFVFGLISFSKEGLFTGPVCWLIAASSQRYRLTAVHIVGIVAGAVFMMVYLVPYSQVGRSYEGTTTGVDTSIYLLSNLSDVRDSYKANQAEESGKEKDRGYFGRDVGIMERLQMIGPDDGLIAATENNGPFGLFPIYASFANWVPHFIWPDKPMIYFGNSYAHEAGGMISEDDVTTGVSFSPAGEAFHLARWYGVALVAPLVWLLLFTVLDSLCGSTLKAPWGLLVILIYSHVAPEGMLDTAIYTVAYGSLGVAVAALASAYVMPILGGLIKGPNREVVILPPPVVVASITK